MTHLHWFRIFFVCLVVYLLAAVAMAQQAFRYHDMSERAQNIAFGFLLLAIGVGGVSFLLAIINLLFGGTA